MEHPAVVAESVHDEHYRMAAIKEWSGDELEIDVDATVSVGEGGAWVHAWVWVRKDESLVDV